MFSEKISYLIDELDQEIRTLETVKALTKVKVRPEQVVLAVEGLKLLFEGEINQAAELFLALSEDLVDRTLKI